MLSTTISLTEGEEVVVLPKAGTTGQYLDDEVRDVEREENCAV